LGYQLEGDVQLAQKQLDKSIEAYDKAYQLAPVPIWPADYSWLDVNCTRISPPSMVCGTGWKSPVGTPMHGACWDPSAGSGAINGGSRSL